MKKPVLTLICLLFLSNVFAQKLEISIAANSGLFSFGGSSAEGITFINNSSGNVKNTYTNNPYGSKGGFSYGLSANAKVVFKHNFILGLDFGYEKLNSKTTISHVNDFNGTTNNNYTATGFTKLNTDFLNLHPNLGYRFSHSNVTVDLTGGFDVGFVLKAEEKGEATTTNGLSYVTNKDRKTISNDIRPRIQLALNYGNFGVYGGYARGLSNYKSGYVGGVNDAYSKLIRFGASFRIK